MASILVWGDEFDACMLARRVLETLNHTAVVFIEYREAIQWVRNVRPQMAILDSKKDGAAIKVLEALKQFNPDVHVLMTTTDAPSSEHVRKIKALGADVYYSRPIGIEELEKRAIRIFPRHIQTEGGEGGG